MQQNGAPPARHRSLPAAPPARHRSHRPARQVIRIISDTPARRVIRIIRIIRSYGHTAAWRCATLPRLPGIEASSLPSLRQGWDSSTEVGIPTLLFCPKNPSPGQRQRSGSDAVLTASLPECFFTTHTPSRQSWRGHRIAPLNSGVGAGLLHSILAWAQDFENSVRASFHLILAWAQDCPGVSLCQRTAMTDSPPGLP